MSTQIERCLQRFAQTIGEAKRQHACLIHFVRKVTDQHHKFIAPDMGHRVGRAHGLHQSMCHLHQQ